MRRAVALLGLLFGCSSSSTALVFEAESELAPGALDEVAFRVTGPGLDGGSGEALAPLSGPEARAFPLTLVLVRDHSGAGGPFSVEVEGRRAGAVVARGVPAEGVTSFAFVDGLVMHHRFLLRAPDATTALPPDAGVPSPATPAMPDPPACPPPQSCGKETACRCPPGCACQFGCAAEKCQIDCAGAGTSCDIALGTVRGANVHCSEGASCVVRADGDGEKRDAKINCSGAACLVDCAGCELMCPGDSAKACGEEARVCNRDCP